MKKDLKEQVENEERWIDYLEGELEPSLAEDLARMLEGDEEAKALVDEYEGIKAYMGKVDEKEALPTEEDYFENMHDKIMAQVDETKIQPMPVSSFNKRSINYALAAVFVCVFSVTAILNSIKPGNVQNDKQVAQLNFKQMLATAQVEDLSGVQDTVISHESEMDFMMNADLEALNNLTDEELESLMGKL